MSRFQPVIVVAAYSRTQSLKRILSSLLYARNADGARLIISIDNDEPHNLAVKELADAFNWPFGEKEVRFQKQHLGLRKHILQCGDLSQEFGSVIILEDDLYTSPWFYEYAIKALEYYEQDERIGGISLYNQPIQEITQYPFTPVRDESDVYFLQFPSSLGQAWSARHWKQFREWYNTDPDLAGTGVPSYISDRWPESSWKKYFCGFLVAHDKYFAFPRTSLTTNFNDPGTNLRKSVNHEGQSPLRLAGEPYRLKDLSESFSVYDSYLELLPRCVVSLAPGLSEYQFVMDLYGTRDLDREKSPMVITSRPGANPVRSFKRAMKPHEMNVICGLEGDELHLCRTEDVKPIRNLHARKIDNYKYFYSRNIIGWKSHLYNYYLKFRFRYLKR